MIGFSETFAPPGSDAPVTRALVDRIFGPGGWLQEHLKLEDRVPQTRMSQQVASAMEQDTPLLFEAGTGCGKSLAYLLPGIIQAKSRQRPLVVSTHTIALQEQIEKKDLPLCRELFARVPELRTFADFKTALFVGRGNYLCTTRLVKAIQEKADLFGGPEQTVLENLAEWSQETATGLIQDFPPPSPTYDLWSAVNADSSVCNSRNCSPDTCPYQAARKRIRQADVIVVNHSLLFALINAQGGAGKGRGILFPNDFVILDEAHTVPAVATEHFGLSLSSFGLERLLRRLYNPAKKKGLLLRLAGRRDLQVVEKLLELNTVFFNDIARRFLTKSDVCRLTQPHWAEPILQEPLRHLTQILAGIVNRVDEGPARDELSDHKNRVENTYHGLNQTLSLADPGHVHWVERTGKKKAITTIRTAPIDCAPLLREALFQRKTSVVLTSATLAPGTSIKPFAAMVGADNAPAFQVASPFDYAKNAVAYVVRDLSPPDPKNARLNIEELAESIAFFVHRVSGGSLVLFTSYQDLLRVADVLEADFRAAGRTLLRQTGTVGRSALTKSFREAGNAILFGTDSFWTGVDVPGPALSQVIVTRLPFENPSHPIVAAKMEWLQQNGRSPFGDYSLPQALIKFRQGVGRLIRTQDDTGQIVLLDPRIVSRPYGRHFLEALPPCPQIMVDRNNRHSLVRER